MQLFSGLLRTEANFVQMDLATSQYRRCSYLAVNTSFATYIIELSYKHLLICGLISVERKEENFVKDIRIA